MNEIPGWVKPSIEKMEPDALRRDFGRGYARMPRSAKLWWNDYLSKLEQIEEVRDIVDIFIHKTFGIFGDVIWRVQISIGDLITTDCFML